MSGGRGGGNPFAMRSDAGLPVLRDCPSDGTLIPERSTANEHVVAFFPLEPATLGHTLVIPRQHIPDIWSLDAKWLLIWQERP
ncbi:HIT domain-containing protein [Micromonospora sp. b486]|uniref:HIT domain-containing protein n=1 Tax=Micromonospora sp. b486 TaxID=3053986 RepID=UPI00339027DA